ncbi:MAG: STAS domain-containing protein [Negativicutes bacterium]|jgi:anti-anti-sigma factor
METTVTKNADALIVGLPKEIHSGNAGNVQSEINIVIEGQKKVIFDFSVNEFVSTAGIRVFLETLNKIQAQNGKMAMFGMNDLVFEVFDITGFAEVFGVVKELDDALQNVA